MSFDVNNNYRGTFYGKDRLPFTTPDVDASDPLRPFLPLAYPAPWLPILRRAEDHPVGAGVVLSTGMLVGQDKSGLLIPAGMISGTQAAGGQYVVLQYTLDDVGFTYNPQTGLKVAAEGEYAVIAAPSDGHLGDTSVTANNSSAATEASIPVGITISANDLAFGKACNLVPGGNCRGLGYVIKNVFQYLGGVSVSSTTGGMQYTISPENPTTYTIHNYMHEMMTAIQTHFVIRVPWVGATPLTVAALAAADGVTGYAGQTRWNQSFVHFTGVLGNTYGDLFSGCSVVASDQFGPLDAGSYAPYNPSIHKPDQIIGKVLGIETMLPARDFADRVRTQFDRANEFVGPFREHHPTQMMMGGSATAGVPYQISLCTGNVARYAVSQGKTIHPEYCSQVLIHLRA